RERDRVLTGIDPDGDSPAIAHALEGQRPADRLADPDPAVTEQRLASPQRDRRPGRLEDRSVPARLVPRERPSGIGVEAPLEADLVAVVDARRARQRRL